MEQGSDVAEAKPIETKDDAKKLSTYAPTPYVDEHWAILNAGETKHGFIPLELAAISASRPQVDPMFEDYTSQFATHYRLGREQPDEIRERYGEGAHMGEDNTTPAGREFSYEHTQEKRSGEAEVVVVNAPGIDPQEHEREIAEARAAAFSEAQAAAQSEADARVAALEARFAATFEDLKTQVAESLAVAEERAAELALSVARKLMGAAAEASPDYLKPLLKEAIAAAGNAEIRRIKVSPQDYDVLKNIPLETLGTGGAASWAFEADDSIHIGCVVVTAAGEVDFNLDKAWERIRKQALSPAGNTDE